MLWLWIFLGMLSAGMAAWLAALAMVCISARKPRKPGKADCGIVLGAKLRPDGSMTTTLQNRVQAAAQAYGNGLIGHILVCGGRGEDYGGVTEAQAMASALMARGIPAARILTEDSSRDTRENLRNAKAILESHGFATVLLITSDYHIARALRIARDMGISAQGLPTPSPVRRSSYWRARFREVLGWCLYFRTTISARCAHRFRLRDSSSKPIAK